MGFQEHIFLLTCAGLLIQPGTHVFVACIETMAEVVKATAGADGTSFIVRPEIETSQKPKNCPVGHFECLSDSSLCVPQASICNSRADCPDNSDEAGCQNEHDKNFWDSLFYKRAGEEVEDLEEITCKYKLSPNPEAKVAGDLLLTGGQGKDVEKPGKKKLRFSRSQNPGDLDGKTYSSGQMSADWDTMVADDWVASAEEEWESECLCVSEKLFCQNLHSANLSSIPRDVEFLDLDGSHVNLMDFSSIAFPQLESLILSRCFIEQIHPGAFSRLSKLAALHLTNNRLSGIASETFVGSSNLHSLFLGYNQLTSLQSDSFAGLTSLRELDLRHNKISEIPTDLFKPMVYLRKLHLSHNQVKSISSELFHGLHRLEMLSLSGNSLTTIDQRTFHNLTSLQGLFLSWNKLTTLEDETFCNLHSLLNLNLKDNEIVRIDTGAFACLNKLESLNLEKNRFGELDKPQLIFENLTKLQHIYFDQFWMCWWAPHVRSCDPKGDGISSVDNLLDNIILRSCVWLMGLIGVAGNLFVIVSRLVLREKNRVHSFYIKNLALADLLMGVFLLSIAVHDVRYRGEFLARQHSWRHSLTCQLSGMLSTVSSEASVLILTLITLDRYLSIVRPFAAERSRGSISPAFAIISFLWILSFSLSYLPLSGYFYQFFGPDFYSTNGLCLPLHIHNPFDPAWEYSFFLFVILNSTAFSFICFAYWKMLRIIQSSSLTIRSTQQKQDTLLAKRFGLVVLTDFLCWAPVIIAKTLAMSGVAIPSTMYAWLAVFVLPVNSALNPIIYTMTTKLFKQQMSKLTVGFRKKLRRPGQLDESTASMSFFYRNRTTRRTITTSFGSSLRHSSVKQSARRAIVKSPGQTEKCLPGQSPVIGNGNGSVGGSGQIHPVSTNVNSHNSPVAMTVIATTVPDICRSNSSPIRTITTVLPMTASDT